MSRSTAAKVTARAIRNALLWHRAEVAFQAEPREEVPDPPERSAR